MSGGSRSRSRRDLAATCAALLIGWCLCGPPRAGAAAPVFDYEVIAVYPHATDAFTQGLIFADDAFYESTGGYGESSLRKVEVASGLVLKQYDLPQQYFAEGLTALRDTLYQLTWTNEVGFRYVEQDSFELIETFDYPWDGWGLTHNHTHLIASDGSSYLRFLDPLTLEGISEIRVADDGTYVHLLNELEYIQDRIYANIWHNQQIAVIDPSSGAVDAWIDLGGLCDSVAYDPNAGVLNGIAYDPLGGHLFVTGKQWPLLFEIDVPTLHPQAVQPADANLPGETAILIHGSNPCTRPTHLTYVLPRAGWVRLDVLDVTGRSRQTLAQGWLASGEHAVAIEWRQLPAGAYFLRLACGRVTTTRSLRLVR